LHFRKQLAAGVCLAGGKGIKCGDPKLLFTRVRAQRRLSGASSEMDQPLQFAPGSASDDLIIFSAEDDELLGRKHRPGWRVLVVDDDADVHASTEVAFFELDIEHRPLEFLHAYSAKEAEEILRRERDVAVVLLDVVMEEEHAGLKLVKVIRETLGLTEPRIVLRTGQPGYAPELEAVRDYDINDYHTKSELTRTKLITTVTSAIRAYQQIHTLGTSRRGLDVIIRANADLMGVHGLHNFAVGVVTWITSLLKVVTPGELGAHFMVAVSGEVSDDRFIVASGGRYRGLVNQQIDALTDDDLRGKIAQVLQIRSNLYEPYAVTLFFGSHNASDMVVHVELLEPLEPVEQQLLEVFCGNIAVGLDNVALFSQLHIFAFLDTLTGLPNRRRFLSLIEERLTTTDKSTQMLALVDIDHFGETNDALGQQFGDRLIQAVAARLVVALGGGVLVARMAGDVFGIFGDASVVQHEALLNLFKQPFSVDEHLLPVTVSIGLVHLGITSGSPVEAFKDASIALKHAKRGNRGNHHYFIQDMEVGIQERVAMLHALRNAFEDQRLFLVYHPQVDLTSGRAVGAEALLRWRTDDGSFVSPDRFIPIAEYSGLIITLGEWVLRSACRELVRLAGLGINQFRMAVNVSVSQFRDPGFLSSLRRALADSGANARNLELEITESVAMEDAEFMMRILSEIKLMGCSISIDDFGTGYSSLSHLQRLCIDRLKIDKAFIDEITQSERGSRIAEMVVQLGRNLGLSVIAEGVENEQQASVLRVLGCHEAQGYLFAKPMPADQHLAWLQEQLKH